MGTNIAARRLGVSVRRITALIEAGILPAQKIGRIWVIEEAVIERLRQKERKPGRPRQPP